MMNKALDDFMLPDPPKPNKRKKDYNIDFKENEEVRWSGKYSLSAFKIEGNENSGLVITTLSLIFLVCGTVLALIFDANIFVFIFGVILLIVIQSFWNKIRKFFKQINVHYLVTNKRIIILQGKKIQDRKFIRSQDIKAVTITKDRLNPDSGSLHVVYVKQEEVTLYLENDLKKVAELIEDMNLVRSGLKVRSRKKWRLFMPD